MEISHTLQMMEGEIWEAELGLRGVAPLVCSGKDISKLYGCNFKASSE